jgi:triosephosphate isomerase
MQKLIFGNWKSNKSKEEVKNWLSTFEDEVKDLEFRTIKPVIAPPFTFLNMSEEFKSLGLKLGVQDISSYPAGSYTGSISAHNLKDFNVVYSLVGHSERRRYFLETSDMVVQKISQAVSSGITPIVCVDESTIDELIAKADAEDMKKTIVAYEPVASIGTGNNAPISVVKDFSNRVRDAFGNVKFLYGGSINETNIAEYLLVSDGVIIGGASLDAGQFVEVLRAAQGENPSG